MSADHVLLDLPDQTREAIRNDLSPHDWVGKKTTYRGTWLSEVPIALDLYPGQGPCGAVESTTRMTTRVPITHGLDGDAVDDHIIALGFVFPDENPSDTRPKKYLRLRLPALNPEELGEEPDDQDLADIEVDPEDRRPRRR